MDKTRSFLIVLIVLFMALPLLSAQSDVKKNILLLHSYHSGMTWVENINRAVRDVLAPDRNDYVLYIEYMDTKRHHSEAYYDNLKSIYRDKYSGRNRVSF